MKDKFTEVYLNIITESWDRYSYSDIINAVGIITNGGKDSWVKEETGKKIFQFLKDYGEKRTGSKFIKMSSLGSKDNIYDTSDKLTYNGSEIFDTGYVYSYWKRRSNSGQQFDMDMFNLINSIDKGTGMVIASKVGMVSYAIWKAMNAKNNKIELNIQSIENNGLDEKFKVGNKFNNLKVFITDVQSSSYAISRYNSVTTRILIAKDNVNDIKIKINLSKGDKVGYELYSIIENYKNKQMIDEIKSIEITIDSATVSKFNKEWKSVTLNRVKFSDSTLNIIDDLKNKFQDYIKEKEQQEEDAKKKNEEERTYQSCLSILKQYKKDDPMLIKFTESIKPFPQEYKNGYIRAYKELFGEEPF